MIWERFNARSKPCPICSGERKDCRRNTSTDILYCRTALVSPPSGWSCLGEDRHGFWKYAEAHGDWNETQRLQYQEQHELRRQRLLQEQARQQAVTLPAQQRDRYYRRLLAELPLHPLDRADLQQRGLTDQQIQVLGAKSVEQWQRLSASFSHTLPGVNLNGTSLNTPGAGYICPIPDVDGYIVGFQIRFRVVEEDEARYKWLTSATKKRPHGPTPHLPNGELPLAVYTSTRPSAGLALVEGTGLKPYLVSQRLGITAIGAAGGAWASSPETLKATLAQLTADRPSKRVTFYPDAGDVRNRSVISRWQNLQTLLESWGYTVQVAWWGQISKAEADIDELNSSQLKTIRCLHPATFWAIAIEQGGLEAAVKQGNVELDAYWQRVTDAQRKLNTLSSYPDVELDCEFLPTDLWQQLPTSGIVAIQSRKGSGKSKAILKPLIHHYKQQGKRILSVTPRVVLGLEQCVKFDMHWINELGETEAAQSLQLAGGVCWDSLWRIAEQHWDVLVLDETRLGLKHLATANTAVRQRRPQIMLMLSNLIHRLLSHAGLVIMCDADLTNTEVGYIQQFAPADTAVFTVVNHHRGNPRAIDFYTDKREEVEQQIFAYVEQQLQEGVERPIIITADSQAQLQALETRLIEHFPVLKQRSIRIDAKTTEEEWGKAFVARPDEEIARTKPLLLFYSPSMEVGVSIESSWFTHIFGFYFGVLEPCEFRQQLARNRSAIPITLWSTDRNDATGSGCRSPLPEVVQRSLALNLRQAGQQDVLDFAVQLAREEADGDIDQFMTVLQRLWEDGNWNNPHLKLWANIQARANFAKPQCGVQLRQELIDLENATMRDWVGADSDFGREVKDQKQTAKQELAEKLSAGAHSDLTVEEAKAIKRDTKAQYEDRLRADGVLLRDYLPGVNLTADFILKRKVEDQHWLSSQFLYWLAIHPHEAKRLDARKWKVNLFNWMKGDVYLPDLRPKLLEVQTIQDLELLTLIQSNEEFNKASPLVQQIMTTARQQRDSIQRRFNLAVSDTTEPIPFIRRLLIKVGLKLVKTRGDGEQRFYQVADDCETDRRAVLLAWDQKYAELQPSMESLTLQACSLNTRERVSETQPKQITQRLLETPAAIQASNEWEKPEVIEDLATILTACEDAATLAVVRTTLDGMTQRAWQAAGRLLRQEKRAQIRHWMQQLFEPEPAGNAAGGNVFSNTT